MPVNREGSVKSNLDRDLYKGNILDTLANVSYDPGRAYSMTWQSGFAGFCWNKDVIKEDVVSMEQLFAPANKGRIVVLS